MKVMGWLLKVFGPRFSQTSPRKRWTKPAIRLEFNTVGSFGKAGNAPLAALISPRSAKHVVGSLPSHRHVSDFFSKPQVEKGLILLPPGL